MIVRAVLALAALLLAAPAMAINKCTVNGKTIYQDAPCANDAKTESVKVYPGQSERPSTRQDAAALCELGIRTQGAWKDPDSIKIGNVRRLGFTTIKLHDATLPVVQYSVGVNGKNSYGGYTGEKLALCFLDSTESRLLRVMLP